MRTYQGILGGGGLEANCVVVETIHVQPMTGVEVPGKRSIQRVAPSLPDGLYIRWTAKKTRRCAFTMAYGHWPRAGPARAVRRACLGLGGLLPR
jgi:hypothetical protein